MTELLQQMLAKGVRIVTLDHHLKENEFPKSGEVYMCAHICVHFHTCIHTHIRTNTRTFTLD